MSNIKTIGQGVRGLRLPKIWGFLLTLNVAFTTVLRTNVMLICINSKLLPFEATFAYIRRSEMLRDLIMSKPMF